MGINVKNMMLRVQFGFGENFEIGYNYLSKIYRMMEEEDYGL